MITPGKPQRAGPFITGSVVHPATVDGADGGIDGGEQSRRNQRDRAASSQSVTARQYRDLSSRRRSFSAWRSWW